MPEILGVTNPVPGYESNNNNNPNRSVGQANNPLIQNASDLNRVTGGDRRSEQQGAGTRDPSGVSRFDSNFQNFVQRLRETPEMATTLMRMLSGKSGVLVKSGLSEGISEEMSNFLKMIQMDEGEFVQFLKGQFEEGSRFNGPLFALLRNAYQQGDSQGLKDDILQFLKKYNDFASSKHIEGNLLRNLNQMARSIPASFGSKLMDMLAKLENGFAAGDRAGNLKLLQGEILPFMSDYVGRTHDLGRARSLLTLVVLDISRYANGAESQLLEAFHLLQGHGELQERLGGLSDQALLTMLQNSSFARGAQEGAFANQFVSAIYQALRGGSGAEAQGVFQNLMSAFLVNESVYMRLNHYMIPLDWNGKMMFSELWVDPDAEPERHRGGDTTNTMRFLFKLDVQSLGFFDVVLTCRGSAVDLQVNGPEKIVPFSGLMEEGLSRILEDNGFQSTGVRVRKMERPMDISEVFPKVFEGRDSINVKV